jgi:hypothetical protein
MGERGKGYDSIPPDGLGGILEGQPRRTSCKRPSAPPGLISPWHTHNQIHKILASPSSHPLLSPQPNTSRQIQAGSLFQIHPQSTQLSALHDPISGQISTIGISIRRVLRRFLHLLSPTSSPKLSSTPRRGSAGSMISNGGSLFASRLLSRDLSTQIFRLNTLGYRIGMRVLELNVWRTESASKAPKREIKFLSALMSIHTQIWRTVFGKPADAIEKSVENDDECMFLTPRPSRAIELDIRRHDRRQ